MELATSQATARPAALDSPSLCAAFQTTAAERPVEVALRTRDGESEYTWGEYADRVRRLAGGFAALGVGKGDTFALMLTNRPEFHFVDAAAMHLGAVAFSVYNTSAPEQLEYLLSDAGNRVIVTETAFLDRVLAVRGRVGSLEHVIVVDGAPEGTLSLDEVEAGASPDFDFEAAWRAVGPDDLLTLIYTSGTTGPPKGVQLRHSNLLAEMDGLSSFGIEAGGRAVSYFPMAHVAERNSSHYLPMGYGLTVTCCPDPRTVAAYLPEVKPTSFFAVPRIWEKLKSAVEAGIDAEPDEAKRQASRWAVDVGLRRVRAEQAGEPVGDELLAEHAKAEELVLSKIRAKLGFSELAWVVVGAAPTPVEVLEFWHAVGVPICEVWGLSETSAVATINPPDKVKLGSVGPAMPGTEISLAEDGEVLVRGGIVMLGYRNAPEKTAEVLSDDGWFASGDIGVFDEDGYLRIVDRKKELIINAAGKNMSPANIEAQLKVSSPVIGQAVAIGDRRPYNVALVTLDPDGAAQFAAANGIEDGSIAALAAHPDVLAEVEAGIARANETLSRVEQIKRFTLLEVDWEAGGDELTPTMKLKRKPIAAKYEAEIEALYR
jgi:long-subunit acyl-CoA synthetase (AMP-forming)